MRSMDFLWTPWRYQYIAQAIAGKQPECIFCDAVARRMMKSRRLFIAERPVSSFLIFIPTLPAT